MNKETFYNYIEQPEILDEKSLKDLSELLIDYPYFQTAQMLYAKNLHNVNHVKYDAQLRLTSAYIYNRKKLFQLINLKPKINTDSLVVNDNIEISNFVEKSDEFSDSTFIDKTTISQCEIKSDITDVTTEIVCDMPVYEEIANNLEIVEIDKNTQNITISSCETEEIVVNEQIITENTSIENTFESSEIVDNVVEDETNEIHNVTENESVDSIVKESELHGVIIEEISEPEVLEVADEIKSEIVVDTSSNIADEILQRIASLKQGLGDKNEEKTESIADIILRKSALAKNKKEQEHIVSEFEINEYVESNEAIKIEDNTDIIDENEEIIIEENIVDGEFIKIKDAGHPEKINSESQINNLNETQFEENTFEIQEIIPKTDSLISDSQNIDFITEDKSVDIKNNFILNDITENNETSIEVTNIIEENILEAESQLVAEIIAENEKSKTENTPESEVIKSETVLINQNFAFNDWFNVLKGTPVVVQNANKEEKVIKIPESELIEKFIKDEPRITPIKNSNIEFNIDISKSSVTESDTFITETLAKIYIKQGYYEKAINIYKKLSLKYSENNTYFAKKIEEVKNLINK